MTENRNQENDLSKSKRKRHHLLHTLESRLEIPMFILAFVWLWLFIEDMTGGLTPFQQKLGTIIWILFIIEYLLKLSISTSRLQFIKQHWLTGIAIFIPALRAFRLLQALTVLRGARVITSINFVRALTSSRRVLGEIREAQGEHPDPVMNIGILIMHSLGADSDRLKTFATMVTDKVQKRMENATGLVWNFNFDTPVALNSDEPRRATDFLEEASLTMIEGPYDTVLVVTDVTLVSYGKRVEAGLPSELCRIAILSTRKLISSPRGESLRELLSEDVVVSGANLLLNLFGHLYGLSSNREEATAMRPHQMFREKPVLKDYSRLERQKLQERFQELPERELHDGGFFSNLIFHFVMALRHPLLVFRSILNSRAIFLPLALPSLATAAVAPTFLLIFTAEIWDVGISMTNSIALIYAGISVIGAAVYLLQAQSLLLPKQEKRILTEHLAVANTVIFLAVFTALCSLFVMVLALMLLIELYIFPEGLMSTWQTMDNGEIGFVDQLRLAAFIATIGVTTGALAGGFESKAVLRHLRLFKERF